MSKNASKGSKAMSEQLVHIVDHKIIGTAKFVGRVNGCVVFRDGRSWIEPSEATARKALECGRSSIEQLESLGL